MYLAGVASAHASTHPFGSSPQESVHGRLEHRDSRDANPGKDRPQFAGVWSNSQCRTRSRVTVTATCDRGDALRQMLNSLVGAQRRRAALALLNTRAPIEGN